MCQGNQPEFAEGSAHGLRVSAIPAPRISVAAGKSKIFSLGEFFAWSTFERGADWEPGYPVLKCAYLRSFPAAPDEACNSNFAWPEQSTGLYLEQDSDRQTFSSPPFFLELNRSFF